MICIMRNYSTLVPMMSIVQEGAKYYNSNIPKPVPFNHGTNISTITQESLTLQ